MMIVPAHPSDAAHLTDVARIAKRHWGYPAAWMEHWSDALCITPKMIESLVVKKAMLSDEIVGFYGLRTRDADDIAWLEHLWVLPNYMNLGWGSALFRDAEQIAARTGASTMNILSDPHAEAFYQRMGASTTGTVSAPMPGASDRILPVLQKRLLPAD